MIDVNILIDKTVKTYFPKFQFRPHQREAVYQILDTYLNQGKKYVILDAPTGSGKSWTAIIVGKCINVIYNLETLILTKTIALQNQYLNDFYFIKNLMGASNYKCSCSNLNLLPPIPLNQKWHKECMFDKKSERCEYYEARIDYLSSPFKCLNYAFFFAGSNYTTSGLLVADEAHSLPDYLIDKNTITLNFSRLENLIGSVNSVEYYSLKQYLNNGLKITDLVNIKDYLLECHNRLSQKKLSIESYINSLGEGSNSLVEVIANSLIPLSDKLEYIQKILNNIDVVLNNTNEHWVIQQKETERDIIFEVKPLHVQSNSLELINKSHFVLLMSATPARLQKDLNIKSSECIKINVPYNWDISNRPFIVYDSLPSMNYRNKEQVIKLYAKAIDDIILNLDNDDSGIIHTVSYSNAELIKKYCKCSKQIYIPTSEEIRNIKSIIKPGRFIASPAIIEGISLNGDLARIQIFLKVPYPNLSDLWIKTKLDTDPEWYNYTTLLNVIQGSGRAIRSKDDFAVTFMLDPNFLRLHKQTKNLIPEWFEQTIIYQ